MARIFITGSSDGLGALTANRLISRGHSVVLHARNPQRAADASAKVPGAAGVLVADLTSVQETLRLGAEADAEYGPFDAVVHNAGLYVGMERVPGKDGLPSLFAVNVLAPYVLSASMRRPKRMVFVSSGMHRGGRHRLDGEGALVGAGYSDTKLHGIMLANAFARRWGDVEVNSLDPGWVPTKMGGANAPDDIEAAVDTYVMLALGEGKAEGKTGGYFRDSEEKTPAKDALDVGLQDRLLGELERISGVKLPEGNGK
ncbi:NAD(P)-binding protein [Coniochaeta ligniaria NRRL 30616]|uniref:NAD(P)-binding protein n=1 Tax=Coniochaeta ligniaria NRRL 30616 TaxID=1408157 RepID=A0A1J7JM38_9PEZI|nr:NAD(P)-binding protein [Coniochaeta ligniaria NRRL 30616]